MYKELHCNCTLWIVGILIFSHLLSHSINAEESKPDKGIRITLSVYSGRPNPAWSLTTGPDYENLIRLIKKLKVDERAIFRYKEWNRLGYASFWIDTKNVKGLPHAIHVWRDMAYVIQNREGKAMYAMGATEIYDLLVSQAEEREQGAFFVNYHEHRNKQKSK